LIVSPALPGSGHVEHACEQQAADFLYLLLDMANIRVVLAVSLSLGLIPRSRNHRNAAAAGDRAPRLRR
jgi:hypothetical protein